MFLLAFSFNTVEGWISTIGYPALFGLLFLCGFGLPVPEDIPLIIAGALIARGSMSWLWAGILAWCGIMGGDVCLYWISRKLGPRVTKLPGIRGHITQERLDRVGKMFDKYGVGVVAVGRLFAGIRGAMVVCAGTIQFNFVTFIIADSLAAIVSGGLWMLLGHWLGQNLTEQNIAHYKHWIIAGMIVLGLGFFGWALWKRRHGERVIDHDEKVIKTVSQIPRKVTQKIKPGRSDPANPAPPGDGENIDALTLGQKETSTNRKNPHA